MRLTLTTLCYFLLSLSCSEGSTTFDWRALIPGLGGDVCDKPELNMFSLSVRSASCVDLTGGADERTTEEKLDPSLDKSPYCCGFDGQNTFLATFNVPRKGMFTDMCTLVGKIKTCVEGRSTCDADWNSWFLENAPPTNLLLDTACDGSNPKPDLKALEDDPTADPACLLGDVKYFTDVATCKNPTWMEDLTQRLMTPATGLGLNTQLINATLHDFLAILRQGVQCTRDIPSTMCSDSAKEYYARVYELMGAYTLSFFQSIIKLSESSVMNVLPVNVAAATRCSAGVTGDPHLFRDGCGSRDDSAEEGLGFVRETCSAAGKQLYLGNKFIQIQGTNTLLPGQVMKGATTLTDIKVQFNWNGNEIGSLSAANGEAPNKLQKKTGHENAIEVVSSGLQNIVIRHKQAGIWIEINVWRTNYFFTIRMSKDLFKESYGLLKGCPTSEVINIDGIMAQARRRRGTDGDCSGVHSGLTPACLYDCFILNTDECQSMTLGSTQSLEAAPQDDAALIASAVSVATPTTQETTADATESPATKTTTTAKTTTLSQGGKKGSTRTSGATAHHALLLPALAPLLLLPLFTL